MYRNLLMIDNFDSFTYNLVDYFRQMGCQVMTYRNTIEPETLETIDFDLLVLSPGPSVPSAAGNMMRIIERFHTRKPIFGVCLGHQALIEFFGGTLKLVSPMHGKADKIYHDGKSIYAGLPGEIEIGRYHSLAGDVIPNVLEVSARSADGTVMSVRHKHLPIEGVQYHPESVLSMRQNVGFRILQNAVNGKLSMGNVEYFRLMQKIQADQPLEAEDIKAFVLLIKEDQLTEDQKLILLALISSSLRNPVLFHQLIQTLMYYSAWRPAFGADGLDICGTGGSNLPRINTSTLVGLTLAALGVKIVKHGNRAASGRFGSFDLLADLGLDLQASETAVQAAYQKTGLAFVFAPAAHPAVGAFAGSRARLGVPTIFNVLGPLLNPCQPKRQFIGTAFANYMELIRETAILLGKEKVMVVRGEDGLDEITVTAKTRVLSYANSQKNNFEIHPSDFGIDPVSFDKVRADSGKQAAQIARQIMAGKLETEHYKMVAINAAFIYVNFENAALTLKEAYQLMLETIKSGKLKSTFEAYNHALTHAVLPEPTI